MVLILESTSIGERMWHPAVQMVNFFLLPQMAAAPDQEGATDSPGIIQHLLRRAQVEKVIGANQVRYATKGLEAVGVGGDVVKEPGVSGSHATSGRRLWGSTHWLLRFIFCFQRSKKRNQALGNPSLL